MPQRRNSRGDSFQGVDAADSHVELVEAGLFDSLNIAIRHWSRLSDFIGAPVQGEVASVQGDVPAVNTSTPRPAGG